MKNGIKNWVVTGLLLGGLLSFGVDASAQTKPVNPELASLEKPYHPEADAQKDIDSLVVLAGKEKKHIILQAGGNWCIWCLRFNKFIQENKTVNAYIKDNFLYYHVNWSPENKNEAVFDRYAKDKGKEYGYPFFIVLDSEGKVLSTRESGNLEDGKSYDETKVMTFLKESSAKAVNSK